MHVPEHFTFAETHALYRPEKHIGVLEAINLVAAAIEFARENHIDRLLVDTRRLTGFESLTFLERFTMAELFAEKARSRLKLALVAKAELIDPEHVGVTVARNRGLVAEAFESDADALRWLLDEQTR